MSQKGHEEIDNDYHCYLQWQDVEVAKMEKMWYSYEITTTRERFRKRYWNKSNSDTYDTAEEMYPIIKNGSANYDGCGTSGLHDKQDEGENLLQKLDKRNIKH